MMSYYQILQRTPFSLEYYPEQPYQPLAGYQLQAAEWDLKINQTHYYEHAKQEGDRFFYPLEIAQRIMSYWRHRYPFADYQLEKHVASMRKAAICFIHKPIPAVAGLKFEGQKPWHALFLEVHCMGVERSMFRNDLLSTRYNYHVGTEHLYKRMGLVLEFGMN
jgi:hypothetical protein